MKRLTSFLLVFMLIFGIAGCANQTSEGKKQSEKSSVATIRSEARSERETEDFRIDDSTAEYIGNKNSRKFHRTSCGVLPAEKNRVYFQSRTEAIDDNYKACKRCNP